MISIKYHIVVLKAVSDFSLGDGFGHRVAYHIRFSGDIHV